jgi:hypothetical protein
MPLLRTKFVTLQVSSLPAAARSQAPEELPKFEYLNAIGVFSTIFFLAHQAGSSPLPEESLCN